MKDKLLYTVHAYTVKKGEHFEIPENTVKYTVHQNTKYLDSIYSDFKKLDFSKYNLIIVYLDKKRKLDRVDELFDLIEKHTGITREKIKGKCRDEDIVFARQLFHWSYQYLGYG